MSSILGLLCHPGRKRAFLQTSCKVSKTILTTTRSSRTPLASQSGSDGDQLVDLRPPGRFPQRRPHSNFWYFWGKENHIFLMLLNTSGLNSEDIVQSARNASQELIGFSWGCYSKCSHVSELSGPCQYRYKIYVLQIQTYGIKAPIIYCKYKNLCIANTKIWYKGSDYILHIHFFANTETLYKCSDYILQI